jgi:hypothetical protein
MLYSEMGGNTMKKIISLSLILILTLLFISGCSLLDNGVVFPPDEDDSWICEEFWPYQNISWRKGPNKEYPTVYNCYSNGEKAKFILDCLNAPSNGFELWIMNQPQYDNFQNNGILETTASWIIYEGKTTLTFISPHEDCYVYVIDNSTAGAISPNSDSDVYTNLEICRKY